MYTIYLRKSRADLAARKDSILTKYLDMRISDMQNEESAV